MQYKINDIVKVIKINKDDLGIKLHRNYKIKQITFNKLYNENCLFFVGEIFGALESQVRLVEEC